MSLSCLLAGCGALLFALALLQFIPALQAALQHQDGGGVDERLTNISSDKAVWLTKHTAGYWGRYGWYLSAQQQGQLVIRLADNKPGMLRLRLWVYNAGALSVELLDGDVTHHIPHTLLHGDVIAIPVNGPCELVIHAANDMAQDQLVLDRFAAWRSDPEDRLPSIYPLMGSLALCLAGLSWLDQSKRFFGGWRVSFGALLIFLAVAVGWTQRWTLLEIARGLPPDLDVVQYRLYAQSLEWFTTDHGFYSGTFAEREPLHIAAINLWSRVWGDSTAAMRWYSLLLSNLLVAAVGVFIWSLSGKWVFGAAAAWIMALSPAWNEESIRGLRTESEVLLLLLGISVWLWMKGWKAAVVLGLVTGLASLLRLPLLGVALPLFWFYWLLNGWRQRQGSPLLHPLQWEWRQLALVSCLALVIFSPHLYGLYRVHGDPSWPSNGYARWNANFEFPERLGTEKFPTPEEFARNPYAGPKLSYAQYLFQLHSLPTLVKGQSKGWLESTIYMTTSLAPHVSEYLVLFQASGAAPVFRQLSIGAVLIGLISLVLTSIGWFCLWRHPDYWWISFLSVWATWYVAYLYSVRLVEPFRHTAHAYPFLIFCFLWGTTQIYQPLRERLLRHGAGQGCPAFIKHKLQKFCSE